MKQLEANYKNSIVGKKVLTLAQCIKIKLKDGRILAFTTHTSDVFFKEERNIIYKTNGFVSTAISQQSTLAISNLSINLIIDEVNIKRVDLEKNNFNDAEVEIFEFNFMLKPYSLNQTDVMLKGNLGEVKRSQTKFDVEFLSKTNFLGQTFTDKVKATCSNEFGDLLCRKDKNLFTDNATIFKVNKQNSFEVSGVSQVNGYYDDGTVENLRTKEILKIKNYYASNNLIITNLDFAEKLEVGDNLKLVKGCKKRLEDCKSFSNAENFNGFPLLPGNDYLATSKGTGKK